MYAPFIYNYPLAHIKLLAKNKVAIFIPFNKN